MPCGGHASALEARAQVSISQEAGLQERTGLPPGTVTRTVGLHEAGVRTPVLSRGDAEIVTVAHVHLAE